jgi:flagellar FliL protein
MTVAETDAPPPRRSKLLLILGLVLGLAGAAGGFMAARAGLVALPGGHDAAATDSSSDSHDDDHAAVANDDAATSGGPVFVPLDPLIVNVAGANGGRFLRFVAQIETQGENIAALETLKPRFADVLNGYLRAVDIADLENPRALDLLRGQMLRRLQTVAGDGKIRDLLIVEFVLN